MSCPAPEDLSRWIDGSADAAAAEAAGRHVDACARCAGKVDSLRSAVEWLGNVAEPGPDCLSADVMAELLEGRGTSVHLQVCPRCAAEFRDLRPARKATRRIHRTRAGYAPWVAAAAALLVAVAGLALVSKRKPAEPATVVVPAPAPRFALPPLPPPRELPAPPRPVVNPPEAPPSPAPEDPVLPPPLPVKPAPVVPPPPAPEPPKPPPVAAPTVTEPERRAVAVALKSGALAVQQGTRWVKVPRVEEGLPVRAEGRTVLEFAGAQVTLEASSRIDFQGFDLALHEGALSAEVAPGAAFALTLDSRRLEPVSSSRVMMVARPDRVIVEEGAARSAGAVLHEGVEYAVRKDRLEPQKRRSLPLAARSREIPAWRMDFSQPAQLKPRILQGRLVIEKDERMVAASPLDENAFWQAQVSYFTGDVQKALFVVKAGTTLRFRYFLTQPAELELVMKNITKDENYNKPLGSVVGRWTTVTLPVRDVPPNRGGKQVPCEIGDRYVGWGLFVGRPGSSAELYVDQLEILEVER